MLFLCSCLLVWEQEVKKKDKKQLKLWWQNKYLMIIAYNIKLKKGKLIIASC